MFTVRMTHKFELNNSMAVEQTIEALRYKTNSHYIPGTMLRIIHIFNI